MGSHGQSAGERLQFLHFIEQELKSKINETFQADPERQLFFGHSLGGLFGLYALFTKPEAFQSYMISSPSIWWNDQCILELEPEFIAGLKHADISIF
ncbi:alpha/beta hydrolase [Cytobacillus firmus]|uniref:alpha/beta hydrolase n=1 Tax=Cytobacillus firmus TaxID=1399 RepID=UPI0022283852|nr:alpha/beta hydrolase-fold protein [Cytobacillus firmus]